MALAITPQVKEEYSKRNATIVTDNVDCNSLVAGSVSKIAYNKSDYDAIINSNEEYTSIVGSSDTEQGEESTVNNDSNETQEQSIEDTKTDTVEVVETTEDVTTKVSIDEVVSKVISGELGSGEQRRQAIESYGCSYDEVQKKVADKLGATKPRVSKKAVSSDSNKTLTKTANGYSGVLTRDKGRVNGPSGSESYYNMNMTWIVARMRRKGYSEAEYPYYVREDGVKMLGPYILVACNFDIRPIGTLVPTTLGTGIVADTGGFIKKYPTGVDIATTW